MNTKQVASNENTACIPADSYFRNNARQAMGLFETNLFHGPVGCVFGALNIFGQCGYTQHTAAGGHNLAVLFFGSGVEHHHVFHRAGFF